VNVGQTPTNRSPVRSVQPYADQCREYSFLAGFLDEKMCNDGEQFLLTETERCILYIALTAIEQKKSMVIHDPFPSSSIPLVLCGTHTYSNRPSLSKETRPMLVFPSTGYTSQFWKFHFKRRLNPPSSRRDSLYPVKPVNALSEVPNKWGLYYAPTNSTDFEFDFENGCQTPSAVFVDLQRTEWSERKFNHIEQLREEFPDVPFIFYTGEMDTAAKRITCKLGVTPLRVTNGLLATATPSQRIRPGESELAVQERIIRTGTNFNIQSIHDSRLSDRLGDIYDMKAMLRKRRCAYPLVCAAYSSLAKVPVQPTYWTRTVQANPGFFSTPELVKKLRQASEGRSTADGDLLRQYADAINDVQGLLNERHPLQSSVLSRIHDAAQKEENVKFVVSNTAQKNALMLALDEEEYAVGANDDELIIERNRVTRSTQTRYIYLYPPYRTDDIFEFPPSTEVEFMVFSVWKNVLEDAIKGATQEIKVQTATTNQNGGDDEDDFVLDLDALDDDITAYMDEHGLSERRAAGKSVSGTTGSEDRVCIHFGGDLEPVEYAASTYVPLYDSKATKVVRKRADAVSPGDEVLLISSVADDLYEALIDDANERESVKQSEERVEDWRAMLVEGMEEQGMSYSDVQKAFAKMDSSIEAWQTIKFWATGHTIGPQDSHDVRRAIELFSPGLTPEFTERRWQTVWASIKHIRFTHHEMGRNVRRYIEAEMNNTSRASLNGVENEGMIRTISRDIDIETVTKVRRIDS
jgi:hypothetical protein